MSRALQLTGALARSCHPGPTALVTLLGAGLAVGRRLPPGRATTYVLAVLTGQLSIGWSNDAVDARRDAATGRADKPAARGEVTPPALWAAAGAAAAVSTVASLRLGRGAVHLVLPAAGWSYNLGLKGSPASALAYVTGFAALPASAWLAGGERPPWWAPTGAALLAVAAHVANVLPDLQDDLATGVRGLPQRLGRRRATALMVGSAAAGVAVLAAGPRLPRRPPRLPGRLRAG
jgi:4-hydroxybenzoate polyprenyltransferase